MVRVDKTSAEIAWTQPEELGSRRDLVYRVECQSCDDRVSYRPRQFGLNITRFVPVLTITFAHQLSTPKTGTANQFEQNEIFLNKTKYFSTALPTAQPRVLKSIINSSHPCFVTPPGSHSIVDRPQRLNQLIHRVWLFWFENWILVLSLNLVSGSVNKKCFDV